jgi:uncharacterized protein (DUF2062 family)
VNSVLCYRIAHEPKNPYILTTVFVTNWKNGSLAIQTTLWNRKSATNTTSLFIHISIESYLNDGLPPTTCFLLIGPRIYFNFLVFCKIRFPWNTFWRKTYLGKWKFGLWLPTEK